MLGYRSLSNWPALTTAVSPSTHFSNLTTYSHGNLRIVQSAARVPYARLNSKTEDGLEVWSSEVFAIGSAQERGLEFGRALGGARTRELALRCCQKCRN